MVEVRDDGDCGVGRLGFFSYTLISKQELKRAAEAQAGGNLPGASEHLARAAALRPSLMQPWEQAGRLALAGGISGKAIEFLERIRQDLLLEGMLDLGQA